MILLQNTPKKYFFLIFLFYYKDKVIFTLKIKSVKMKKYPSKIDTWLVIIMVASLGIPLVLCALEKDWWALLIMVIATLFVGNIFLSTNYTIKGENLMIKSGIIISKTIKIKDIYKIEKTNSILSSPALSLDRIEIFYGNLNSIIISPKEKMDFITELLKVNENIKVSQEF